MNLKDYLWQNRLSYAKFAKTAECTATFICLVANGKMKASRPFALLIEFLTNGQVTKNEVLAMYKEPEKKI